MVFQQQHKFLKSAHSIPFSHSKIWFYCLDNVAFQAKENKGRNKNQIAACLWQTPIFLREKKLYSWGLILGLWFMFPSSPAVQNLAWFSSDDETLSIADWWFHADWTSQVFFLVFFLHHPSKWVRVAEKPPLKSTDSSISVFIHHTRRQSRERSSQLHWMFYSRTNFSIRFKWTCCPYNGRGHTVNIKIVWSMCVNAFC